MLHTPPLIDQQPTVSVVTVALNEARSIRETLDSVAQQTYDNVEHIVIDGGSTDGTREIIEQYADELAHFSSEPDGGIYQGMNTGLQRVTGEWVNFMNAGDWFETSDAIANIMASTPEDADIVYGDSVFRNRYGADRHTPWPLEDIVYRLPFCHQSTFVRTELARQTPFDESYRICADHDFFLQQHMHGAKFAYVPELVASFDCHGISSRHPWQRFREYKKTIRHAFSGAQASALIAKRFFLATKYECTRFAKETLYQVSPRLHNLARNYVRSRRADC